jgi:DNA-binding CsgD family transcriptional regulator
VSRLNRELNLAQRVLNESHAAVVWLKNGAQVQNATLWARVLLTQYFPGECKPREALPELLQRWLGQELARFGYLNDVPSARRPLTIPGGSDDLIVRIISDNGQLCLLLEESHAAKSGSDAYGLTPRESEVMEWVSRGKTNWEIALILNISARTVQKHLEHIFQKLGVETRTAAAAKALPSREN